MWTAAEQLPTSDNTTLLLGIIGLLGTVVTIAGGVIVALINSRNRTAPSPPPPAEALGGTPVGERLAAHTVRLDQLESRAEEGEDRDEMQDRQLQRLGITFDQVKQLPSTVADIVRHLDRHHDGWR